MKLHTRKLTFIAIGIFCLVTILASQIPTFAQQNNRTTRERRQNQELRANAVFDLKIVSVSLDRKNNVGFTLFNASEKELPYTFWANQNNQSPSVRIRVDGRQVYNVPIWRFDPNRKMQRVNAKMPFITNIKIDKAANVEVTVDSTNVVREKNEKNNSITINLRPQVQKTVPKTTPTNNSRKIRTGRVTLEKLTIHTSNEVRDEPYLLIYTVRAKIGTGTPQVRLNRASGINSIRSGDNWGTGYGLYPIPSKIGQVSFRNLNDYEIYGMYYLLLERDNTSAADRGKFALAFEKMILDAYKSNFQKPTELTGTHKQKFDETLKTFNNANGLIDPSTLYDQYTKARIDDDDYLGSDSILSVAIPANEKMPTDIDKYFLKEISNNQSWKGHNLQYKNSKKNKFRSYKKNYDYTVEGRHEEFVQ